MNNYNELIVVFHRFDLSWVDLVGRGLPRATVQLRREDRRSSGAKDDGNSGRQLALPSFNSIWSSRSSRTRTRPDSAASGLLWSASTFEAVLTGPARTTRSLEATRSAFRAWLQRGGARWQSHSQSQCVPHRRLSPVCSCLRSFRSLFETTFRLVFFRHAPILTR